MKPQSKLIGHDPHTREEIWVDIEQRHSRHTGYLGYRLAYNDDSLVLDIDGRWIPYRDATPENSTWRNLDDAEKAAYATLCR